MFRLTLSLFALSIAGSAETNLRFRAQQIAEGFGIGYAVLAEDVDGDGKTDIVAINETTANWWRNPGWERHVILDGKTEKDNVAIAAHDIDGDGKLDLALAAAWRPSDTQGGGTLQWIGPTGDPGGEWKLHAIGAEPTLHRIRWGDTDGDGRKSCSSPRCTDAARLARSIGRAPARGCS